MTQTTTRTAQPTETKPIVQPEPIAQLPAVRPRAGGIHAIIPKDWGEVVAMASAICRAGMAPKSYCKTDSYGKMMYADGKPVPEPEKVAIAIMHGMEVGLTPMASLQSLAVINGMPSLYGDGLMAVVRASGLLEDMEEGIQIDSEDRPMIAWCKVKRRGETTWKDRELTYVECVRAGWTQKDGPWKLTPARMMTVRVRGWLLRDMFADVLRGLHSAEEMEDMVDVTPQGGGATAPAEPKREDFNKESAAPADQAKKEAPAAEKKPRASRRKKDGAESKETQKGVTDVVDQNAAPKKDEPLEFETFTTTRPFMDFSSKWLAEPGRTAAEVKAWNTFYSAQMEAAGKSEIAWVKEGIADLLVQYGLIVAKAEAQPEGEPQREPGQDG